MSEEMQKFEVKKVAGPLENGAAIFLGNDKKIFVVFVGFYEATAIVKEIQKQTTIRPLTHDLLCNILFGFDIEVKKVVISRIVDNTFCATLMLEQKIMDAKGNWTGKTKEVHVDARASDSIVIALKKGMDIWVTKEVYEKVEDVSEHMDGSESPKEKKNPWEGTEIPGVDFQIPDYPPEDEEDQ